jgi:hypothetical protein
MQQGLSLPAPGSLTLALALHGAVSGRARSSNQALLAQVERSRAWLRSEAGLSRPADQSMCGARSCWNRSPAQDGLISGDELFGFLRSLLAPCALSDRQLSAVVRATLAERGADSGGALTVGSGVERSRQRVNGGLLPRRGTP